MIFRALPSLFPEIRVVGAKMRGYSFVISSQNGEYKASWKNIKYEGAQTSNYIDGSPFKTFDAAYEACKATYKQLRAKQ